jgi:Cu-Zn family superoxide dismutase
MLRIRHILGAGLIAAGIFSVSTRADQRAIPLDDKTPTAVAEVHGTGPDKDKVHGTVLFHQTANGVHVKATLDGLTPGKHGFHIHQDPIKGDDLKTAGGHWNPHKVDHGAPDAPKHHSGDLGNITADEKGHAELSMEIAGLTVTGTATDSVIGHSVIVHAKADDLKTQPTGDAGDRVGGGNIELKKE